MILPIERWRFDLLRERDFDDLIGFSFFRALWLRLPGRGRASGLRASLRIPRILWLGMRAIVKNPARHKMANNHGAGALTSGFFATAHVSRAIPPDCGLAATP
jgi:hypothetical protein